MMRAVDLVGSGSEASGREGLRVSVVVPVFNSAAGLVALHERVAATLDSTVGSGSWELILVNDGSADESWARIIELSREHPAVRGLDLTRNWGQHNALLAGVRSARHEVIVTLDDDLQNPPEEIPKLLDALGPEVDVVYGVPMASAHPTHRRIGGKALRAILRVITGRREAMLGSGFRAYRSRVTAELPEASGRSFVLDAVLRSSTDRIESVAVRHEPRRMGRSNYTFGMLVRFALVEIATDLPFKRGNGRAEPSYRVRTVTEPELSRDGS
jgi:glycosyltransferase involved in cell wall biosynthesis